jgi:hypothetical protein
MIEFVYGGFGFFGFDHLKEIFDTSAARLFRGVI